MLLRRPKPELNYKNDTTLCFGEVLTLQPTTVHQTVNWNNASITSSISVSQTGYYYATVNDNGCTSIASDSVLVVINSQLQQPLVSITTDQDSLFSNQAGYYYHWYLNGVLLPDTTQYILPAGFGDYTNSISDSLGCISALSSPYHYSIVTGTKEAKAGEFSISPNPNDGYSLMVSSKEDIKRIEIYTSLGKQAFSKTVNEKNCKLTIDLPDGSYYITVITADSRSSRPFIVSGH